MSRNAGLRPERGCNVWAIVGWAALVAVGVGLAWYGFIWPGKDRPQAAVQPSATAPAPSPPSPTAMSTLPATDTPLPTFTPEPTPVPPTETPPIPNIVAGADGANVRTGPGTNFTRVGYLDPGAQAPVTGRYGGWWQIDYAGAPGWVFGEIVTASNTDGVPEVQPPPTVTPPPTATLAPSEPTATPGPSADFRGLKPNAYWVEDAPGPFAVTKVN